MFQISCYSRITRLSSKCRIRLLFKRPPFGPRTCSRASSSTSSHSEPNPFERLIKSRRSEAERSILVQVSSEKSFSELADYCQQFGTIQSAHHYSIANTNAHFILIEYGSVPEVTKAINHSVFKAEDPGVPCQSKFLWFRTKFRTAPKGAAKTPASESKGIGRKLNTVDGIAEASTEELTSWLLNCASLNDQIRLLYEATRLNDLGTRLRFLAAQQVQDSITGMFPKAIAYPFGSSVNGFGKIGCDLDMILCLEGEQQSRHLPSTSRFVFHTKQNLSCDRAQNKKYMEIVGDILQQVLPGTTNVRRILQARVPIIKYSHEHLDLEVDLSMNNLSGMYMSELLYLYGELDERVRPLIFCVRQWAKIVGLTNRSPGVWITNFSLSLLVLYFLQCLQHPILPPLNQLYRAARPEDKRLSEDGSNYSFLRDLTLLSFTRTNDTQLDELLLKFFEFYSQFDFINRGLSLNEAKSIAKPDHSALFIMNPLQPELNVSKNVSLEEMARFRIEVRNAAWMLESHNERKSADEPWGLQQLFKTQNEAIVRPQMFLKPRMIEVSDLFGPDSNAGEETEYKMDDMKALKEIIKAERKSTQTRISRSSVDLTKTRPNPRVRKS